ncbi:MAG: FAD-binding protein [Alphaproteobacteria bacterium]|nr:FAD-binding protein [Alphaproteobacteria bacterium]
MIDTDLAIIGAGAAGLAAATEAVEHGLTVTIADDNPRAGGQYFRQPPLPFRRNGQSWFDKEATRANALFDVLGHPKVTHIPDAVVWNLPEPNVLAVAAGDRSTRVRAGAIVVATGAHDRPVPFPGWTLPGVITAGGAQNLLKGNRMVPGRRIVVAGNGPLLFVVGASLVRAGVDVAAIVEAAPVNARLTAALPGLLAAPKLLRQAIDYRWTLLRAGVPVRTGMTAVAAHGEENVNAVSIAPIDGEGRIDRNRIERVDCDALVVGFGLTPSVELMRLIGCDLDFHPARGGWLPRRSTGFETSVPGVFAAGDGAAIGGVEIALLEGRLAALEAAVRLGRARDASVRRAALTHKLARIDRFRRAIERLFAAPCHYLDLLADDTVVCRCEEVTAGELKMRGREAWTSMVQLKSTTRLAMGRCQGRNCMATLASLVAQSMGEPIAKLAYPRTRPPARPIALGDLLHEPIAPPELPADPHLPRGQKVT